MSPSLFKVLAGIIVDAKLVKFRRTYLFWGGAVQMFNLFLASLVSMSPFVMALNLHISQHSVVFMDTCLESIMI